MTKIERVQTGLRLEKRLLKVMKGLAEHLDISTADLVEGVMLHAMDGKAPFSGETREKIAMLKQVYGLDLNSEDSHRLKEEGDHS